MNDEARDALELLAGCESPRLIGLRHHSVAIARVMPALLDEFKPESLLIELPPDFSNWLSWLGHDDLEAPVALAASCDSQLISFYPFADFSPELVAIRWATKHGVPIVPCDLELQSMHDIENANSLNPNEDIPEEDQTNQSSANQTAHPDLTLQLIKRTQSRDSAQLWDRIVETPSFNSTPEQIRRAALLFGWMVRRSERRIAESDQMRESAMRGAIESAPKNSVAIIGSFHASALLPDPILWKSPESNLSKSKKTKKPPTKTVATSLVAYSFQQLDARSGYPAGIMDPVWQQKMLEVDSADCARKLVSEVSVALCRDLRREGHVAGTPDAIEIARVASDLARIRGLPSAGRTEFLEALESILVQGDLFGRGRAVANAAENVLVSNIRGSLPSGTPRSGLAPEIEDTLGRLKLPGPDTYGDDPKELRLDPLRSRLDRARAVVLRRLNLIGVKYAQRIDTESVGARENLTEMWRVQWTHASAATLQAADARGVTLVQAAEASVNRMSCIEDEHNHHQAMNAAVISARLAAAAECGLVRLTVEYLKQVNPHLIAASTVQQLVDLASLIQRIASGHVAGLPVESELQAPPEVIQFCNTELLKPYPLVFAALRQLDGLIGSTKIEDVVTMAELTSLIVNDESNDDKQLIRLLPVLKTCLNKAAQVGSPLVIGAAHALLAITGDFGPDQLAEVQKSWFDNASNAEGRKKLGQYFAGCLNPLLPLLWSDLQWLNGLNECLAKSSDDAFLCRLKSLRGGFSILTPADRARLLRDRLKVFGHSGPGAKINGPGNDPRMARRKIQTSIQQNPELVATAMKVDFAGREAIIKLLPELELRDVGQTAVSNFARPISEVSQEISLVDRWRLVLGVKGSNSAKTRRVASALDQLYGNSTSESTGDRADLVDSSGGGTENAQPTVREWIDDLTGLFGKEICEEVLGESAADGRSAVLDYLDPDQVKPSIELLEQVLSLQGGLPEKQLSTLRRLAAKITEQLAKKLANRLRPSLSGLSTPVPTRRKSPKLDLQTTIRENLHTARRNKKGQIRIAPDRMVFRSPARRQMDWELIFVVDVSGSMEPSVIYSAMMAAIFSSLPAIEVRFFAFSMEVIDFSKQVDDPLALLLEIEVGGGTHIGLGLRAAREAMRNPSRTLVVTVSDFEEGVSIPELLYEARQLVDSGAKTIGLAALDDQATPRFHKGIAAEIAGLGMPVAAVSPEKLAQWVGDQIKNGTR